MICCSGPPEIVVSPTDTLVSGCQTLFATCVAVGTQLDTITFTHGGVALFVDDRTNITLVVEEGATENTVTATLQLCTVTLADAGVYGCIASSAAGTDTAIFNVTVPNEMGKYIHY